MTTVVLSRAAEADLESINEWIGAESSGAAAEFIAELREACVGLGSFPERFSLVPRYAAKGIRRRPCRNYLIFYAARASSVEILRILHGARAYEAILFRDLP
jgi:toxin ParE1/3/4